MSVSAPKDTLLYQRHGRPLTMKRDISTASMAGVAAAVRQFKNDWAADPAPEREAVEFYLANHAMKELEFRFDQEEPLPDWAVDICNVYHAGAARIAARAFYYLLLITAREARHDKNKTGTSNKVKKLFGEQAAMALLHYPDYADVGEVTKVFDTYASSAELGQVCRSISYSFYEGSYSPSYGGKKWGVVADCMVAYMSGEYTAEMMLDTVWTLCHNGGPIFNKGMLYQCHNSTALQQVLDIQRAGQIPRFVLAPYGNGKVTAEQYVSPTVKAFAKMVSLNMPDGDFKPGGGVDYKKVDELGAVGSYKMYHSLAHNAPEPFVAQPAPFSFVEATDKTHYIIAKKHGLMFKKVSRKEVHSG